MDTDKYTATFKFETEAEAKAFCSGVQFIIGYAPVVSITPVVGGWHVALDKRIGQQEKILDERVLDVLEPSVRLANCLIQAGIITLRDLVKLTEQDLQQLRNFGSKTLKELKDKLGTTGLCLRNVIPVERTDEVAKLCSKYRVAAMRTSEAGVHHRQDALVIMGNDGAYVSGWRWIPSTALKVKITRW